MVLARRPEDDAFWSGLVHVAGSAIWSNDPIRHEHDYEPALTRALGEMNKGGTLAFTHDLLEIETVHRPGIPRGPELTVRFWGEVTGEPGPGGAFYGVEEAMGIVTNESLKDSHAKFIALVAGAYATLQATRYTCSCIDTPPKVQFGSDRSDDRSRTSAHQHLRSGHSQNLYDV